MSTRILCNGLIWFLTRFLEQGWPLRAVSRRVTTIVNENWSENMGQLDFHCSNRLLCQTCQTDLLARRWFQLYCFLQRRRIMMRRISPMHHKKSDSSTQKSDIWALAFEFPINSNPTNQYQGSYLRSAFPPTSKAPRILPMFSDFFEVGFLPKQSPGRSFSGSTFSEKLGMMSMSGTCHRVIDCWVLRWVWVLHIRFSNSKSPDSVQKHIYIVVSDRTLINTGVTGGSWLPWRWSKDLLQRFSCFISAHSMRNMIHFVSDKEFRDSDLEWSRCMVFRNATNPIEPFAHLNRVYQIPKRVSSNHREIVEYLDTMVIKHTNFGNQRPEVVHISFTLFCDSCDP